MLYEYASEGLFRTEFLNAEPTGEFRKFACNQPGLASYVVKHAFSVFLQYQYIWENISQFAGNYAETINYYTTDNLDVQARWALHARTVRKFMLGS